MTITPLWDSNGTVVRFVALKQDVTERKRVEARLQMLANALEGSPELVGMAGPDGTIVYVNAALQETLQISKEDLAGKHFRTILSANNPPELLREIEQKAAQPGGWRGECLVPRNDGTDVPVLLSSSAVLGKDGQPLGVLGIAQDISERKRAEERISLLSRALDNTSEFIAMGDRKGTITFVNTAWTKALGYSEEELVGKPFDDVLSPNNPIGLSGEILFKTLEGGWTGECLHRRKDGSELPVLLSTGPVLNGDRGVIGVFGIARDITARKKAEQEILLKNILLEAQAEATLDGILAVDEANRIILFNQQFAKLWGIGPAVLSLGGDDSYLLGHVLQQVQDSSQFLDRIRYLYEHRDERAHDEIRLRNGTVLDRYSAPLVDSVRRYCGRIWYFRDVTERIKAQERLQLWSQVLDQSTEGIFICDPQERILLVSKAFERLTGYSNEEVLGQTPRILHSGRQDRAFYSTMWKSIQEEGAWQGEIWNRRKNGEVYPEWLSVSAVRDRRDGPIKHYVGIFSDITAHKKDQERMLYKAHHDALTDLPNRILLMDRLNQLIKGAQRNQSKVGVIFIDLDRFKEVNDSLGHDAGDLLLQALASRFSQLMRREDTLARIGGDEFIAVVQGIREGQDVALLARGLLSCLAKPVAVNGYELTVTASIGISLLSRRCHQRAGP